jgi:hypothetical protein
MHTACAQACGFTTRPTPRCHVAGCEDGQEFRGLAVNVLGMAAGAACGSCSALRYSELQPLPAELQQALLAPGVMPALLRWLPAADVSGAAEAADGAADAAGGAAGGAGGAADAAASEAAGCARQPDHRQQAEAEVEELSDEVVRRCVLEAAAGLLVSGHLDHLLKLQESRR